MEKQRMSAGRMLLLGVQHAFAMFCATILVPTLTGLDTGVALFAAGIGTLIFHFCTKGKVPVFLGSSFAFIASLSAVIGTDTTPGMFSSVPKENIPYATGAIMVAGAIYLIIALLVKIFGSNFIDKLFPPVVRGVGIAIIGLNLAPAAINNIQVEGADTRTTVINWLVAAFVCLVAIVISSYGKGMLKLSSIIIALTSGYLIMLILVKTGIADASVMNFAAISQKSFIELPAFQLPKFDIKAIALIAPIALVTAVEHVGDIYANGSVVGKNFVKDPGLHRTMMGDGLATMVAGFMGGPANTTYSENTAVLATTGNYNPGTLRVAAVIAIIASFFGKFIGIIETIPTAVLGGSCILLYGMISSVGLRTLVENKVDFKKNRNLSIAAVMLVLALGGAVIGTASFSLSGIGLGIIVGIILNLVLPETKAEGEYIDSEDDELITVHKSEE